MTSPQVPEVSSKWESKASGDLLTVEAIVGKWVISTSRDRPHDLPGRWPVETWSNYFTSVPSLMHYWADLDPRGIDPEDDARLIHGYTTADRARAGIHNMRGQFIISYDAITNVATIEPA